MGASGDTIRLGIEVDEQQQARQVIAGLNEQIAKLRSQILALAAAGKNSDALGNSHHIHQLQALKNALSPIARGNDDVDQSARRAAKGQQQLATTADAGAGALKSLERRLLELATAFAGFKAFEAFVREGFDFNRTIQGATLGIATLITAQAELRDSGGRLLEGTDALNAAQGFAADQVQKLRVAGIQTAATTKDLINAFNQGIAAGLRYGLTLDQIRQITIGVSQAATALQLPMNQLNEEIRDLIAGNISARNTRIATALGITNEDIRHARETGQLADFIIGKLKAFNVAGQAVALTFDGVVSNIKEGFQVFAGDATKPLFESFRKNAQAALADVFDLDTAQISEKFRAILDVATGLFDRFGDVLAEALDGAVSGAKDFNNWLKENEGDINAIADAIGLAAGALGTLLDEMLQFVGSASHGATESGGIRQAIVGAGVGAAALNSVFEAIVGVLGIAAGILAVGIVGPFGLLTLLVGKLVGILDKDLGNALQKAGRDALAFERETVNSVINYERQLATTGDAIDRYLAKVKALDEKQATFESSRKIRDQLREQTSTLRQESKAQEEALKRSLDNRRITRQEYVDALRFIQLREVKSEQQATLDAIRATTDPRLKRALFDQIAALQQRRNLLEGGTTLTAPAEPETDKQRKQRIRLLNQRADDEIKAEKALADRLTAERTAAFDDEMAQAKNQFDSREQEQLKFLEDVEKIQFKSLEAQKAIEQKRADALAGDPEQAAARQKALDRVQELSDAEFKLIADTDAKIANAHRQALEARRRLDDQGVKDEIELLRTRGEIVKATALELELQYKDELEALAKRTDAAARQQEANIHKIIDTGLLKAQFEELDKVASEALTHLSQKEGEINTLRQTGAISEKESRREIIDLYKETSDTLGELVPQLEDVAERSGDRASIERVRALKAQFEDIRITVNQVDENIRKLETGTRDALEQGIAQGLDEMTDGVHRFADAWGEAAGAVVASLRRIAAEMLATLIIEKSLSFLGGLLGFSGSKAGSLLRNGVDTIGGGGTAVAADGAYIDVPGRPTDRDTIPAMLANKEFVVNAKSTAKAGPDAIAAINRGDFEPSLLRSILRLGRVPRARFTSEPIRRARGGPVRGYAAGGLVAEAPIAGLAANGFARLLVEHSEDTIVRVMESTKGQQVQVKNIGKTRNATRFALGDA